MSKGGNPPSNTRFKPGQSGNPRGRPKGAQSFRSIVQKLMRGTVTITENGRKRKITKAEALARSWLRRGFEGDMKAIASLAAFQERHDPIDAPSATPVGDDDLAIIASFLKREASGKKKE